MDIIILTVVGILIGGLIIMKFRNTNGVHQWVQISDKTNYITIITQIRHNEMVIKSWTDLIHKDEADEFAIKKNEIAKDLYKIYKKFGSDLV